jgi:hypothetical protein
MWMILLSRRRKLKPWKLFLDDDADGVRRPDLSVENPSWRQGRGLSAQVPDTSSLGSWQIARSVDEAFALFDQLGLPSFISFDHDLCDRRPDYTGFRVAEEIVRRDMISSSLPFDFAYEVHSWNPIGGPRIVGLLDGYLAQKRDGHISRDNRLNELSREEAYNMLFTAGVSGT